MDDFTSTVLERLAHQRQAEAAAAEQAQSARSGSPVQAQRWNAAHALNRLLWEHLDPAIRTGARHPDRPIELSFRDTCLLNFGTTPELVETDLIQQHAQTLGEDAPITSMLPKGGEAILKRTLGFLEMQYSELHASSGVYNLEPWLQEMYRDCLDVDYRRSLQDRARILQEEVRSLPDRLLSMGIPNDLVTEIVNALRSYRQVQDQARAREKSKTSVVKVREHAAVTQKIDRVLSRADPYVQGSGQDGRSPLQEIFSSWKEAQFELMDLNRQLEGYTGSGREERIEELLALLSAARRTLARCAEEMGFPQCSLLSAEEAGQLCPRQVIEEELEALLTHDFIGHVDLAAERLEMRRFGPLCALIMPGAGSCCYSTELREAQTKRLEQKKGDSRDYDLDRRANYPLNYIVVPSLLAPEKMLESMADAFLDYKAFASRAAYRNTVNDARKAFPEIFESQANQVEGTKHVHRKRFARYVAAFVRWAKYGRVLSDLPCVEEFISWARARLQRPEFVVRPRYRCVLEDFTDASPERRETIYIRHMRDRYMVDRLALVLATLEGDIEQAVRQADFLSAAMRENPYFGKALEPVEDGGPWGRQNASRLFQKFLFSEPELKRLYLSMEMRFNAELDTVRKRAAETLGRELPIEEASQALARRHWRMLEDRRLTADSRIDRDLVGLLYCAEKNYPAAKAELKAYLEHLEQQRGARSGHQPVYDGSSLKRLLGHRGERLAASEANERDAKPSTRVVGGEETDAVFEDDFVYYNLGSLCIKTGDLREASDYFSRFCLWAAQQHWHLFGEYAREINEELENEIANANANEEADGTTASSAAGAPNNELDDSSRGQP